MADESPESTQKSEQKAPAPTERVSRDPHYHKTAKDFVSILLRRKVSQNRWRFEEDGFNMDLAYITDRIIAMGYPAEGKESLYRNSMHNTVKFLWKRHGKGHVKIFNLRGGHMYKMEHYGSDIICFNMEDHHPPSLELMAPFCREAKEFLDADPENVIAVHCKAGKGRTGVMICALLIYINYYPSPRQILDYYSIVRTQNNKGVTIPSQRRYVYYFDKLRRMKLNYFPTRVKLVALYVECPPETHSNRSHFHLRVLNGKTKVWDSEPLDLHGRAYIQERDEWKSGKVARRAFRFEVKFPHVFLEGDVQVQIIPAPRRLRNKEHVLGHVWFNTMFVCVDGKPFEACDNAYPYEDEEQTSICKKGLSEERVLELPPDSKYAGKSLGGEGLRIEKPAGYEAHNGNAEELIYKAKKINPPNLTISNRLHRAHVKGLVKDDYNTRKNALSPNATLVKSGVPFSNQPDQLQKAQVVPHNDGEHVLEFPIYEIDDMVKNKKYATSQFRLFVVVRCIDQNNQGMKQAAEQACRQRVLEQQESAWTAFHQSDNFRKFPPAPVVATCMGAEQLKVPNVRYADKEGGYKGHAHPNLSPHEFQFNVKSRTPHYYRYFFRQRRDSVSKYPGQSDEHWCPLIPRQDDGGSGSDPKPPGSGPSTSSQSDQKSFKDGSSSSFSKKAQPPSSRATEPSNSDVAPGASGPSAPHTEHHSGFSGVYSSPHDAEVIDYANCSTKERYNLAQLKLHLTRLLGNDFVQPDNEVVEELNGFAAELGRQFVKDPTRSRIAASVLFRIGEAMSSGKGWEEIFKMLRDVHPADPIRLSPLGEHKFLEVGSVIAGLPNESWWTVNNALAGGVAAGEVTSSLAASISTDPTDPFVEFVAEAPVESSEDAAEGQEEAQEQVLVEEAPVAPVEDAPVEAQEEAPVQDAPVAQDNAPVEAEAPSDAPSSAPTNAPTEAPPTAPSNAPSSDPTNDPTTAPTTAPPALTSAANSIAEMVAADAVIDALSAPPPSAEQVSPVHVKKLTTRFEEISSTPAKPVLLASPKKKLSRKVTDVLTLYSISPDKQCQSSASNHQPALLDNSMETSQSEDAEL